MESIQELFSSLESINPQTAEDAKNTFHQLFLSTKESWLLNGMFDYYIQSGSVRAIDVLNGVREPHDRYLFDRLTETLRGLNRLSGLTLLGHVVRRRPSWIYRIASHNVFKELLRILKSEKDIVVLMSALLIVVILLPIIASLISPHLSELFDIFSHLAGWNTNNPHKVPEGYLLHLEIGMYALFNRLYGMFPCNFLSYLRQHYSSKESLPVFSRTIKPMLDTVRMHPLLVTASKELEISANRWKKIEANDVIIECAKFSIENNYDRLREDCSFRGRSSSMRSKSRFDGSQTAIESKHPDGFVELGNHGVPILSSFSTVLPEPTEIWSPAIHSGETTPPGASSIPQTPIIQGCVVFTPQGGNSPPEAAIEATPESTPIKDMHESNERAHSAVSSTVVRTLNNFHSQPSSPLKKEHPLFKLPSTPTGLQRVQRVITERNQIESGGMKGKGMYPPGSPLRVIPQLERQRPHTPGDRSDEDREVETTFSVSPTAASHQVTREDSVLGESSERAEDGEWREWREGGDLCMPESRHINHFARRLRCFSQCQPESFHFPPLQGINTAGSSPKESIKLLSVKLRRTASCPDLTKPPITRKTSIKTPPVTFQHNTSEKSYISLGTQTDPPKQPLVYEQLLSSVLPPMEQIQQHSAPPDVTSPPSFREDHIISSPRAALDCYIDSTVKTLNEKQKQGVDNNEIRQLREQLVLLTLQLQFERHRREVHAERNRRLLGRYREHRVLEEHNSALRDQVQLLHSNIEMLHNELNRFKNEARSNSEEQRESLSYWEEQNSGLQRRYKESTDAIKFLNEDLKEEKRRKETIAKGYTRLESEVFDLRNMMDDALIALQRAEEVKSELAILQHHMQGASELENRLRSWINDLQLNSNKGHQAHIATRAYQNQFTEMQMKIDSEELYREAANEKFKQAELLYAKSQALSSEQSKLIQSIISDCDQQLQEKEEACTKLRELNTQRELEMLRLQAQFDCLEDKVKRFSSTKSTGGPSPQLSNSPHLSSGSISIAEEMTQILNLQLLVDQNEGNAGSSRDISFPP